MKIVLASHGPFAQGLCDSVQMVLGEQEGLSAHCLMPEETPNALSDRLEQELKDAGDEEVLFLTDLYHGTPFNVIVSLMKNYRFYHVTGINLPLLIDAVMNRNAGSTVQDICARIVQMAAGTVIDVNCLFEESEEDD